MHDVLWRRFFAMRIDEIFIVLMMVILIMALPEDLFNVDPFSTFIVLTFILVWLYFTIMESSKYQGTLGKILLGVRVVDESSARISFGRANARYWGKILSGSMIGIGFLMAIFSIDKQALHDKIARTYVVDKSVL